MKDPKQAKKATSAPLFVQMLIYVSVLLISQVIAAYLPASLPIPSVVIGLVLLYVLLSTHVIKLEWVDSLGASLISMIGFMFVPSGISLAANLDILKAEGIPLILMIALSTIIMLVVITYVTHAILTLAKYDFKALIWNILTAKPLSSLSRKGVKK